MKCYLPVFIIAILWTGCSRQAGTDQPNPPVEPADAADSTTIRRDAATYQRQTSSTGQLVYVPVYSHIYQQDRQKTFNLTATLSIRNADPFRSFTLTEVTYYDSDGNLVQHFLEQSRTLKALSSTSFVVEERDLRGGVGANFLVSWEAAEPVNPPVIEAVMISTSQQQGISFVSEGRILQERSSPKNNTP